jgi:hypothetical protein
LHGTFASKRPTNVSFVPGPSPPSPRARVEAFFDPLLARDSGGGSWLPALLAATPHGRERLGELVDDPGWLEVILSVATADGPRGAFTYPALPTRELLAWYVDHPEALARPQETGLTVEATRLHQALFDDDPPGTRSRAQERARELLGRANSGAPAWWRFEQAGTLHGALITDRLVLTVLGAGPDGIGAATPWFPQRSELVRDLEGARRLADGAKSWATVLISDETLAEGTDAAVAAAIAAGAPHLDAPGRAELQRAYLGNLTWAQAAAASSPPLDAPPAP